MGAQSQRRLGERRKVVGGTGKGKGSPGVYDDLPADQIAVMRTKTGKPQKTGPKRTGPPALELHGSPGGNKKVHFVPKKG